MTPISSCSAPRRGRAIGPTRWRSIVGATRNTDDVVDDAFSHCGSDQRDPRRCDVSSPVERERPQEPAFQPRLEQLLDDRRASAVRARDCLEQHLCGSGGRLRRPLYSEMPSSGDTPTERRNRRPAGVSDSNTRLVEVTRSPSPTRPNAFGIEGSATNWSPAANTTSGPTWRRTSSSKRLALFWACPAKKYAAVVRPRLASRPTYSSFEHAT